MSYDTGWRRNKYGGLFKVDQLKESEWKDLPDEAKRYANFGVPRDDLYQYQNESGKAFIRYNTNTSYIYALGSTGGRAGTEAFIKALEQLRDKGNYGANWEATGNAPDYYTHLGLNKYGSNEWGSYMYHIPHNELPVIIEKLKTRRNK